LLQRNMRDIFVLFLKKAHPFLLMLFIQPHGSSCCGTRNTDYRYQCQAC
jgi:hypothetical protein